MTQTLALFLDAYRELNARKMFWITLILSAVFIGGFALVGLNGDKVTIFRAELPMGDPTAASLFYRDVFNRIVVGFWFQFAAMILALISTAGIFPDFIAGGSIDLFLSKPIGRLRLFLTKYVSGLLFVLLQAVVFAAGCFLVMGLRGHEWRPGLFLVVPLTLCMFSYLFCVCALLGITTRSTVASILLTVLFWFICIGVSKAEQGLYLVRTALTAQARAEEAQARSAEADLADLKARPSFTNPFGLREGWARNRRDKAAAQADAARTAARKFATVYEIAHAVATVVPKTGETVDLLDRKLFSEHDVDAMVEEKRDQMGQRRFGAAEVQDPPPAQATQPTTNPDEIAAAEDQARERDARRRADREAAEEMVEQAVRFKRQRSVGWVVGTSLGFEAVVLAWAAWLFCRREF